MKKHPGVLPAALVLLAAALACTISVGGPDLPENPPPVSTEAVLELEEQIEQALEQAALTGQLSLAITESQLTSLLAFRLNEQEDPALTDPQVYLRDGQMQVYGKAHQGIFVANVGLVLSAAVDENGQPKIEVVSVDLGPLPAPEGLNRAIAALVTEAYAGSLGPVATGIRLESITIADGLMTLSGQVK
ncbi:MAG: hypothetical protein AB1846_10320 [Chloroflexota bacterium]